MAFSSSLSHSKENFEGEGVLLKERLQKLEDNLKLILNTISPGVESMEYQEEISSAAKTPPPSKLKSHQIRQQSKGSSAN